MNNSVDEALRKIGLFSAVDNLQSILEAGQSFVRSLCEDSSQSARLLSSYLKTSSWHKPASNCLTVDIGGSFTKAALRDAAGQWLVLFELSNEALKPAGSGANLITQFTSALAEQIVDSLKNFNIDKECLNSVAVVWSNAIENRFLGPGRIGAVTATEDYKKGEWFVESLPIGTELTGPFFSSLVECGLSIEKFILSNDTPFTLLALNGADSGVVASTGVNATLVRNNEIANAEMGASFAIPEVYLCEADYVSEMRRGSLIEFLIGGSFIPRIFGNVLVNPLISKSNRRLSDIADYLGSLGSERWLFFDARDLASLLGTKEAFYKAHPQACFLEGVEFLEQIAAEVVKRAASLLGVVIYCSVYNQLNDKDQFRVSLDSWLAREIPLFNEFVNRSAQTLFPTGKSLDIKLQEPLMTERGSISVPMQGAANALSDLA